MSTTSPGLSSTPSTDVVYPRLGFELSVTLAPLSEYVTPTAIYEGLLPFIVMDRVVEPLQKFFESHTKEELTEGSVERRILLFPVATPRDLLEHPQLEARGYFKKLEY